MQRMKNCMSDPPKKAPSTEPGRDIAARREKTRRDRFEGYLP
jgi:hypothetical protein